MGRPSFSLGFSSRRDADSSPGSCSAQKRVHRHGFQCPWHPLQVLSLLVLAANCAFGEGFIVLLIDMVVLRYVVAALYGACIVALTIATIAVTRSDPSDVNLPWRRPSVEQSDLGGLGIHHSPGGKVGTADSPYCSSCEVHVAPKSMHCNKCGRCVTDFDHHCRWFNNCIGSANYTAFVAAVLLVILTHSIVLVLCFCLLTMYVVDSEAVKFRLHQRICASAPGELVLCFAGLLVAANVPLLVCDTNLCLLHIALRGREMTTYEYVRARKCHEKVQEGTPPESLAGKGLKTDFQPLPRAMEWLVFTPHHKTEQRQDLRKAGASDPGPSTLGV